MSPTREPNVLSRLPVITIGLIAVCTWIYFVVQPSAYTHGFETSAEAKTQSAMYTLEHAAVPCELSRHRMLTEAEVERTFQQGDVEACSSEPSGSPATPGKHIYLALLYSLFLHASILHLFFNMLFLWAFGASIEDRIGRLRYLVFFVVVGVVANVGHVLAQPNSTLPVVGASGAIAGVMGMYLVLYPLARMRAIVAVLPFVVPAWLFLSLWVLSQFILGPRGGVAWVAHVVGFVVGIASGIVVRVSEHRTEKAVTHRS